MDYVAFFMNMEKQLDAQNEAKVTKNVVMAAILKPIFIFPCEGKWQKFLLCICHVPSWYTQLSGVSDNLAYLVERI